MSLEPISKSPEEDKEASELDEAEEVLWVELPSNQDAALPLNPGEEAFDELASLVSHQPAAILCRWLGAVRAMGSDQLDAVTP